MVAAAAIAVAGCGGGPDAGSAGGGGLDTKCLEAAGLRQDDSMATVVLDGAEPIYATAEGVTIYQAKDAAAAARIADEAKASEVARSSGRYVWLSDKAHAAAVERCVT